jgi:exodeoxyribonuclease V gamma subunit
MSTPHATGFMVLHSNQLEGLRDLAVAFIRKHPLPALAPEVLLVQSNGMKHWLELALAKHLGVCAATQVALPSAKLWQIYRAVLGHDAVPAQMPLDKSPLVWRIMRRLPELMQREAFAPLAQYLNPEAPYDRRAYQLAMQLADVFDGYQNYRADWLDDWANTRDQLRASSGLPTPLPPAQSWQPALWRDLLEDLQADANGSDADSNAFRSRAEVHDAFVKALAKLPPGHRPEGVPHRVMVFGVTSLPMQTVQALAALGRVCQVLMLVQNPCQYHWGHVVQDNHLSEAERYQWHTESHPLLAAWGKQGRDYLHLLDNFEQSNSDATAQRVDVFIDPRTLATQAGRTPTHLEELQSSLLNLEPIAKEPQALRMNDHSVVMLQTHSAQREVEVLHDQVLAWLDADPHLSPNDIMVMVPDMALFAPHIHAVFGRFAKHAARHLPYSVADTTPRTEPLVQALELLLQLPQLRITQNEWQSLFEVEAIRHSFALESHDVAQLDDWLTKAHVRWGLDAEHRAPWGMSHALADAHQNSWLFGLERLLLGYATATDAVWQNTLAEPGIGGLDAQVIDGLLQWLRHIQQALQWLRQEHTPSEWVKVLQQLVACFFKPNNESDERLLERVLAPLENWLAECELARMYERLPLVVVREHWLAQLQQTNLQRRFFGGGVQFATLMPMRSIPFKVVCLLGMNDGDYPRNQTPRDFDLLNQATHVGTAHTHWRAGDRSRREDDRYLFLEALLAAREKLYISWQGRRTTDHEKQPACVLVAQLLDYLNNMWVRKDKLPAFEAPLQPLQSFSPLYFTQDTGFTTYATDWQTALLPTHGVVPPASLAEKPADAPAVLTLQHLQRLLKQPVEVFLHDRLRIRLDAPAQTATQEEPFALPGLEKYKLTQNMAMADDAQRALTHLHLRGQLALAGFGQIQQAQFLKDRQTLRSPLASVLAQWPDPLQVQSAKWEFPLIQLHAEWAHDTSLWRSHAQGTSWLQVHLRPGAVTEGKKEQPQARLDTLGQLWVNHLAACASGTPTTSLQIGLDAAIQFSPIERATALNHLQQLCEVYLEAFAHPLPVAAKTACAYWTHLHIPEADPLRKARDVFEDQHLKAGEYAQSPALQRVFQSFDDIAPHLHAWAERLYAPMFEMAQVVQLEMPLQQNAPNDAQHMEAGA